VVSSLLRSAAQAAAEDDSDQVDAVEAQLTGLGEPAIPSLAAALSDPDENVRLVVVQALAGLKSRKAVEPLVAALADESPAVRLEAAAGLGPLRDRRAAQPLLDRYRKDEAPQVRAQCLRSLTLIGDPQTTAQLRTDARATEPYMRGSSIAALCQMQDEQAPDLALAHARDPNLEVSRRVLDGCEHVLDSVQGNQLLIDVALSANDPQIALLARRNLNLHRQQGEGAGELTEHMRQAGRAGLTDPTQAVNAALLLGDLGDPAAIDVLMVAAQSPDFTVRFLAVGQLCALGDRRAVPALIKALGDQPLIRCPAHRTLKKFASEGDTRAAEAIRRYGRTDCDPPFTR
jgi:HEAT repeat protein